MGRFAWIIVGILLLPLAAVVAQVVFPSEGAWSHLFATVLPGYVGGSLTLMALVAVGVVALGVPLAWLVTLFRFPFRSTFDWALLLPFAAPSYILAYVYTDFLQFTGPVQTLLRRVTGWEAGDYPFPDIRSVWGAALLMSFTLFPYVYMLARASFLEQSTCLVEAARTLGSPLRSVFWRVGLPLARPATAAGLALALMEVLGDFGTVDYFAVDTFTTGIYRTWFGMGSRVGAAQLATALLAFVASLVAFEKWTRRRARFHGTTARHRPYQDVKLRGAKAFFAVCACTIPIVFGFGLPLVLLLAHLADDGHRALDAAFLSMGARSLALACAAAVLCVGVGAFLGFVARFHAGRLHRSLARGSAFGYAVPGAVLAVGTLIVIGVFDAGLAWVQEWAWPQERASLFLGGTLLAVLYAYSVRFATIPFQSVDAALVRVTPSIEGSARVLGCDTPAMIRRVHVPIVSGSLVTAALLVFVDVVKELPATMILRPFNFETLALRTYTLASDERLGQASPAALLVVLVGIVPVALLTRVTRRKRPSVKGS